MNQAMQAYWQRDPTNATRDYWRPVVDAATAMPEGDPNRPSLTGPVPPKPGVDLRPAAAYSYEYKDPSAPGAAAGPQVGPMAQDLEKSPAAAHVVHAGPDGMKRVDTGRLSLVNTAAISQEQKRVDRLEALLAAHEKALATLQPQQPQTAVEKKDPNYAALDDAYSRMSQDTAPRPGSVSPDAWRKFMGQ